MRIERLALKGLLRFAEPIDLNLRDLPDGLIALTGENGAGKSTLLESPIAALFRGFASRDGELYEYATGRDSFIEADIALDGRGIYRARVNVDGPKRASDAVLQHLTQGGPVTLNDGKVSTFDVEVAARFPAKELLLASAFAAQNKAGSFISLDKKKRKELFMRLLAIERYQAMSETAAKAGTLVSQARQRQIAVRDTLAPSCDDTAKANLDHLANRLQAEGGTAELEKADIDATIATLEQRCAAMQDTLAAYASAQQRVRTLEQEQATRQIEHQRAERELATVRETATRDRDGIAARCRTQTTETDTLIANNHTLLANKEAVVAAVAAIDAAQTALAALRPDARAAREALTLAERDVRQTQKALDGFERTRADLQRAHDAVATLQHVPCGGTGTFAACQFLVNAKAAQATIPGLVETLRQEAETKHRLTIHQGVVAQWTTELQTIDAAVGAQEHRIHEHTKLAALRDKVTAATARIEELETKKAEYLTQATAQTRDLTSREQEQVAAIGTRLQEIAQRLTQLATDLQTANVDMNGATAGNARALAVQADLASARQLRDVILATLARVETARIDLERRRQDVACTELRIASLTETIAGLDAELLDWQFFAKALGRDGLPVLEIDAAGPTISAYTNELLTACFGARFSVELITQREKADGKGYVDDFTIHVFDNAQGGDPRDLSDLSGGEQVIVAEALMNAISIYVNTTSPLPVRTCWRDETTGALDPENATRYLAMLRKVRELGGFHQIFFISHNPDVAAEADAQIRIAGGRAAIALPPFADAGEAVH